MRTGFMKRVPPKSKQETKSPSPSDSPGKGANNHHDRGKRAPVQKDKWQRKDLSKTKKTKTDPAKDQPVSADLSAYWQSALVLLVIVFFASIRIRLLDFPLERDEGEYAYAGQLILQGIPPYQLAYNMKLPGTYYAYALILSLFGQTPAAIHLGLLVVNAATTLLVFFLTRKLFGPTAGVVACASYGMFSLSPAVLGFAGHATHFVVLFALAGLLSLQLAIESKKIWLYFTGSLLLGMAFLMKQPGAFFVLFAGLYLIKSEWTRPVQWRNLVIRAAAYSLGACVPFGLVCLILYKSGVFQKFWFWTFSYASAYGTILSFSEGLHTLSTSFPHVFILTAGLWLLAAVGLGAVLWNRKLRNHAAFAAGFLLFSFAAVSVGLYYRPHYYVLMLPAVAMLTGVGVSALAETFSRVSRSLALRFLPAALFLLAFGFSVFLLRQYFFDVNPVIACRLVYGFEPFPEALKVADYIKAHSPESARIVVMGSEPEIYFYSHRHSATGYIYMYGLLEEQKYALTMQKEMIGEIEATQPDFLVVVKGPPGHWGMTPGSETMIFNWAEKYVATHYALVGSVDVRYQSDYHWDSDVKNAQFLSPINVLVFKKNS
jgi:hypothetical protein